MDNLEMLVGAKSAAALQAMADRKVYGIMSYLSKDKWRASKVLLSTVCTDKLSVEIIPGRKAWPVNVKIGQSVGMSLKHGYGKFVFETTVADLCPSTTLMSGGVIILKVPDEIKLVQKRNYFRVRIPAELCVSAVMQHRMTEEMKRQSERSNSGIISRQIGSWTGHLVDLSAGGAQVAIGMAEKANFKRGQFVEITFAPLPDESPLSFNAQIKNIIPTADSQSLCYGLQIVGLDASARGRETLQRLCDVVERYYQMNQ